MSCEPCTYEIEPTIVDPSDPVDCQVAVDCLISMVRVYLGDFDGLEFTNERLLQVLGAAQFCVSTDLACCDYVKIPPVSTCGFTCFEPTEFPSYAQLLVLKAVCIINMGVVRGRAVADGIRASCGPASLSISSSSSFFDALAKGGACKAYDELKIQLCFKCPLQSGVMCAQIVGAFTSKNMRGGCCTSNHYGKSCQH